MIVGIGIDLVDLRSLDKVLERYFLEFCSRCFDPEEMYQINATPDRTFAAGCRFAIKEAVLKALGTGLSNGIGWNDVHTNCNVRWSITLTGQSKLTADDLKITKFDVTTSNLQPKLVVAIAIAQTNTI